MPKGGALSQKELQNFVNASYKKKSESKKVDGYDLDTELSTKRNKVYHNKATGDVKHVITGTEGTFGDWSGNLHMLTGTHHLTNRHKKSEAIQQKANAKYNKKVDVVSHSKSGQIAKDLNKKGLSGESTTLNPSIIGRSDGLNVVRSSGDLVSSLTKTKPTDTIIKQKYSVYDPRRYLPSSIIGEHGTKILGGSIHDINPKRYM